LSILLSASLTLAKSAPQLELSIHLGQLLCKRWLSLHTLVGDLEFQLDKLDPYAAAQDIKPFKWSMKIDKEQQRLSWSR
jgi:hypothetical protein